MNDVRHFSINFNMKKSSGCLVSSILSEGNNQHRIYDITDYKKNIIIKRQEKLS